ncbi:unnamed protein product [Spirodela intermedia]|uniref:Uncharacterized protein n=1 Tax=Spirodela intermedia TaxID=51605 RepID=A0A7I8ICB0_SPIIN|nr:unnamed protein product [Spirodela intermedia]CAA6654983.1 unnamed protein product [Spirodela intermedia]
MARVALLVVVSFLCLAAAAVRAEDPYLYFTWRGILINGQFPGPNINSTTNNNIVINVFNDLDEPFLLSCRGRTRGRMGCRGPTAPSPREELHLPFPGEGPDRELLLLPVAGAAQGGGGFGGLRVNSRLLIPVPFDPPADDFTVLIGDWYVKGHHALKEILDSGRTLGRPNGVLMNGRSGKSEDGKNDEPLFTMKSGKIYRYRICNVGMKTSLNFRIQGHSMKLVEMDGSHTMQNSYESLDVHVGQCYSVLVTADQKPRDYYMVASTRFTKYHSPPPAAARPNPQGSYHYGSINITRTVKLANSVGTVGGKTRYAINGASFESGPTPLKLAEYFGIQKKAFQYDVIADDPPKDLEKSIKVAPIVLTATFRTFIEIILENPTRSLQSYHLDGYSFFPMGSRRWSPEKRKTYNLLDAVSRHTIQVYPRSWTAIMLTFDNAGMWNLRSEIWERHYLGQQLYTSVISPAHSLRDEYNPRTTSCSAVPSKASLSRRRTPFSQPHVNALPPPLSLLPHRRQHRAAAGNNKGLPPTSKVRPSGTAEEETRIGGSSSWPLSPFPAPHWVFSPLHLRFGLIRFL